MNAVMKPKAIWDAIREDIDWERRNGRDLAPDVAAHLEPAEAAQYVAEQGESVTDCLVNALTDAIDDDRQHGKLNNELQHLLSRGEDMPMHKAVQIIELLRQTMTAHVRARVKRRIERELI